MSEHCLSGLVGDNLLAFLAAVGTLRTLGQAWRERDPRIRWGFEEGAWRPFLVVCGDCTQDEVVSALNDSLGGIEGRPEFTALGDDLPTSVNAYREQAQFACHAGPSERRTADFLAAYGTEAHSEKNMIADTALRTMSGAGHQHFLAFMRELVKGTSPDHLRDALFKTWDYKDERPAMRWDPADDRRYALRASDPGDSNRSPIRTVRGANRLAIEALPAFPTFPATYHAQTRAVARIDREIVITWPIWQVEASADAVCSLLAHPELTASVPKRLILIPLGVGELYRSRRLTIGRFRNFMPSVACWGSDAADSRAVGT